MERGHPEAFLEALNPAQRRAVEHGEGPALVLAGAGSGKTRVLTFRFAYLVSRGVSPSRILCLTFTNKAAREMRERLASLGFAGEGEDLWISTFHAACARILRMEGSRLRRWGRDRSFTILDAEDQREAVKACLRSLNLDGESWHPAQVAATLSRLKEELVDADSFSRRASSSWDRTLGRVFGLYERRLRESNALDFSDLLLLTYRLLEEEGEVLERYRRRFEHLLVDEYQDTNHAQYVLLRLLAGERGNVFAVGDVDQSIYGFRGADIRNILHFERDFPQAAVYKLEENYRSTPDILEVASQVISRNRLRRERGLYSRRERGERVKVVEVADERGEASFVAGEILRRRREGWPFSSFAVLYRTHAQSRLLEEVFLSRGIPYLVLGGFRFYERKEVKDVLAYLRFLANPRDFLSFQRAVQAPRRGVGAATLGALEVYLERTGLPLDQALSRLDEVGLPSAQRRHLEEFLSLVEELRSEAGGPLTELIRSILERSGYRRELESLGTIEAQSRLENLEELLQVAREWDLQGASLEEFLESLSLMGDQEALEEGREAVVLLTVHTAKGLEFDAVFLVGLEEGIFPHRRSLEEGEVEEERRLFYVGMTRARHLLYLTRACSRHSQGVLRPSPPSRFLREFDPALADWVSGDRPEEAERVEEGFRPGDRVIHRLFGPGRVVSSRGEEVTVDFGSRGIKTLMIRYAPLEKV